MTEFEVKLMPSFYAKAANAMKAVGQVVQDEMIKRVPVKDGDLGMSIFIHGVKTEIKKPNADVEVTVGTQGIWYAELIEYGLIDNYSLIGKGTMVVHGPHIPEQPLWVWDALIKRKEIGTGQNMPFARSADFFTTEQQKIAFIGAFK